MRTKTKIAIGVGVGVGIGVGGTIVAQKCYEKYQRRLVEEFIEADIDDTVSGWDSEDEELMEEDDEDVLEETSEDSSDDSEGEEKIPTQRTSRSIMMMISFRKTKK